MRFDELGLDADILRSLEAMNFEEMTPVQEHTIPIILENKDLIGCAQTGTGKTAAYTLPLLDKLLREGNPDNVVKSLIVVFICLFQSKAFKDMLKRRFLSRKAVSQA